MAGMEPHLQYIGVGKRLWLPPMRHRPRLNVEFTGGVAIVYLPVRVVLRTIPNLMLETLNVLRGDF